MQADLAATFATCATVKGIQSTKLQAIYVNNSPILHTGSYVCAWKHLDRLLHLRLYFELLFFAAAVDFAVVLLTTATKIRSLKSRE